MLPRWSRSRRRCPALSGQFDHLIGRRLLASVLLAEHLIYPVRPSPLVLCQCLTRAKQVGEADQVVGQQMQPEHRSHTGSASGFELPQSGRLLDPASHLLDPLPGMDRLAVALMPSGSSDTGGAAAGLDLLRFMRRDAVKADVSYEIPGVVALVGAQRLFVRPVERTRHARRRRTLAVAVRGCHLTGHHQTVAVLHVAVAQVAEVGPGAVRFSEQPGLPVAAGAMGLVGEQQTAEVASGSLLALAISSSKPIATTGRWRIVVGPIDPLQRAMGRPDPQQGVIDRELLRAQ